MTVPDAQANAQWRKSTYTAQGGADCVEVAALANVITQSDNSLSGVA
ncbi:DUF397 domain-containing protein [Actinoallomurus soli]